MSLAPGARLGPYEVVAPLGEGGMGAVYRARDTKLHRDVALKVLPDAVASDPDRLARFEREARMLAALNHPHIAAIYGLHEGDVIQTGQEGQTWPVGVPAETRGANVGLVLVMELVEGPTLAELIGTAGLPIPEALAIARQIAEALGAAHEQGIVHRDLKPANIKVRSDGTVKVLDFGLARAIEGSGSGQSGGSGRDATQSPTLTSPALMTGMGVILGTAAYMAPEQAKGRVVDKRADIWAFGCVLYEMLTGVRPFDGGDTTDVLGAVVRLEPDWSRLPSDTPPAVRSLVQRCLVKDPRHRIGDVSTASFVLDPTTLTAAEVPRAVSTDSVSRRPAWRRALPAVLASLVTALAVGGIALWQFRPSPKPASASQPIRFTISTPPEAPFRSSGAQPGIAISPDGARVVYRTGAADTPLLGGRLWVRDLYREQPTELRGTKDATGPFFSPDGEWIAYNDVGDGTLKRVPAGGGLAQTICSLGDRRLRGASWGSDGTIVFATSTANSGLEQVPASGGTPKVLVAPDASRGETYLFPEFLPDGKHVVFTISRFPFVSIAQSSIWVFSFEGGRVVELLRGGSFSRYSSTGHLLFATPGTLMAVPFDPVRAMTAGAAVPVLESVLAGDFYAGVAQVAVSGGGSLIYVSSSFNDQSQRRTLVWIDRDGREEPIEIPPASYTDVRLSPEGNRIALASDDGQRDILVWDLKQKFGLPLTSDPSRDWAPVWTRDGRRLAFTSGVDLYWQPADGSAARERLTSGMVPQSFSPDGKRLLTVSFETPGELSLVSTDGTGQTTPVTATRFDEDNADFSPDGRWIAYQSDASGRFEIYIRSSTGAASSPRQITSTGGFGPLWSRDGRELFYESADSIMTVPIRNQESLDFGAPALVTNSAPALRGSSVIRQFDVSPDGKRFLVFRNAAPGAPPTGLSRTSIARNVGDIHFIANFGDELNRLAPAK